MNNTIMINLDRQLRNDSYRMGILLSGACPSLLPMSTITEFGLSKGFIFGEGFMRLSDLNHIPAGQILHLLSLVIRATEECEDFMLFSEEYILTPDTVYVSENYDRIKIAYIPTENQHGGRYKLQYFVHSLKALTTENGKLYLETLEKIIQGKNLRADKIIGTIEELKEEIHLCEIQ